MCYDTKIPGNNLKNRWSECAKVLFIAANPNDIEKTESYRNAFLYAFPFHGMKIETYAICDCRNEDVVEQLSDFDVIILSGGHVPTRNLFLQHIGLKEKLDSYNGIIIGISAGTMNCADIVYAHAIYQIHRLDSGYKLGEA